MKKSILPAMRQKLSGLTKPNDSNDLTHHYNTPLGVGQEKKYQAWKTDQNSRSQYPLHERDYDMRGAFRQGLTPDGNLHWDDKFKKPNHVTFSSGSMYSAQGSKGGFTPPSGKHPLGIPEGGEWITHRAPDASDPKGHYTFVPTPHNLQVTPIQKLKQYWGRAEPHNNIVANGTLHTGTQGAGAGDNTSLPAQSLGFAKSLRYKGNSMNKSRKTVLDRMDKFGRETREVIKKEEKRQKQKIHSDHTQPGVPAFVGKFSHDIDKHSKRLAESVKKLRQKEKQEVREEMSRDVCPRCKRNPCICGNMKKAQKKYRSFNVQSSEIARKEGVSEKAADAILASRARNHGAKKSLMRSTAQLENYLAKAQSVLSTPKARVSARDVDGEGHLSDAVESRTSSADQRRRAESRMARRSTMKPNNIREVNRRQIDRDISRPGSRVNIAQGRRTKLAERASGMKTKGDLPIPVPPDPYRAGEGTGTQRRDVRQRADERMRGHEAAESAHEERIYRQGAARRRERLAEGIPDQDLDWDGGYYND